MSEDLLDALLNSAAATARRAQCEAIASEIRQRAGTHFARGEDYPAELLRREARRLDEQAKALQAQEQKARAEEAALRKAEENS